MKAKNPLPVWYKPILSKEERDSPMLLCRKPELPKHFSRKRIKELATPKVCRKCICSRIYLKVRFRKTIWIQ